MFQSFRFWCCLAAVVSLLTTFLHVMGGGPQFHEPALASELTDSWKTAFSTIWHEITVLLLLDAVFLAAAALQTRRNALLLYLVFGLNFSFGALFFFYGVLRLGTPFVLLQWILFFAISLPLAVAMALRDAPDPVTETSVDPALMQLLPGTTYADSYTVAPSPKVPIRQAAELALGHAPRWVDALMSMRNMLVKPFGLVTDGSSIARGRPMIGMFPLLEEDSTQVVLGLNDRHLDFRVILRRADQQAPLVLTTLVKTHGLMGRAYLMVVLPFHRLIVRTLLQGMLRSPNGHVMVASVG